MRSFKLIILSCSLLALSAATLPGMAHASDITAPLVPTITPISSPTQWASGSRTINFTTSESGGSVQCKLDSDAYGACASYAGTSGSYTIDILLDGTHTLLVQHTDAAGNTSPAASFTWVVDTAAPDQPTPAILASPTRITASQTIRFTTSESGGTVKCKIGTGDYGACTSYSGTSGTYATGPMTDGQHTFLVQHTDAAGNASVESSMTWIIDSTPPNAPTITQLTTPTHTTTTQTITFTTSESRGTLQCKLDAGAYGACASYASRTGTYVTGTVTEGSHTFSVKHTDAAGNTSVAGSMTWVVDNTPPVAPTVTQLANPNNTTANQTIVFATAETGGSVQCQFDGGGFGDCASYSAKAGSYVAATLAEGQHTFQVKHTDAAGNTSDVSSMTWAVDATPPTAPVMTQAPASTVYANYTTITWTKEDGSTSWCQLDSQAWAVCSSPKNLTGLSLGNHTFKLKSIDPAGNSSDIVPVTWTASASLIPVVSSFDVTPEVAASGRDKTAQPTGQGKTVYSSSSSLTYTLNFENPVSGLGIEDFAIKSSAKKWVVKSVSGSGVGPYTVTVTNATITAGTVTLVVNPKTVVSTQGGAVGPKLSAASATTVMVDQVAPLPPVVTGVPKARTAGTSLLIGIAAEPNAASQCALDGQAWAACGATWTVDSLGDGLHTITVRQTDQAGNVGLPATKQWTVHTTNPDAPTITAKPAEQSIAPAASVWFTGESQSTFSCQLDQADWSPCQSPFAASGLGNGAHQMQVKQTDELGKTSTTTAVSWTTTLPATPASIKTFTNQTLTRLGCSSSVPLVKNTKTKPGTIFGYAWLAGGKAIGYGNILYFVDSVWGKDTTCVFATQLAGVSEAYASVPWNQALPLPVLTPRFTANQPWRIATAAVLRWQYGPVTTTYQWTKDGAPVAGTDGADSSVYKWTAADVGQTITCVITITNSSGSKSATYSFKAA